jgi:3-hydroxymyristoyl/3-hydroxydecanoyl-(acyl carrier protein) dehydratase
MDLNYFWRIMQILFALATVLAILYGLYLTRNWSKRNMAGPGDSIDVNVSKSSSRLLDFTTEVIDTQFLVASL